MKCLVFELNQRWVKKTCFIFLGLMITSAALYHVLHFFHVTIDIRNVCVFLAPLFSSFTALVTYHLTKELKVCFVTAALLLLLGHVEWFVSFERYQCNWFIHLFLTFLYVWLFCMSAAINGIRMQGLDFLQRPWSQWCRDTSLDLLLALTTMKVNISSTFMSE